MWYGAAAPPAADTFVKRVMSSTESGSLEIPCAYSTVEAREPVVPVGRGGTVWWQLTVPRAGTLRLAVADAVDIDDDHALQFFVYSVAGSAMPTTALSNVRFVDCGDATGTAAVGDGEGFVPRSCVVVHVDRSQKLAVQIRTTVASSVQVSWVIGGASRSYLSSAVSFPRPHSLAGGILYCVCPDGPRLCAVGNVTFASTRVRTCAAPPANDNFASAKALSGRTGSVGGSTVLATTETGEVHVDLGGGGDDLGFSVWYRWSAPARGRLELSVPALAPEGFETVVAVFVNAPTQAGLRRVASSGFDRCPEADAADMVCVNMQVDQSVTYAIAVGAFDGMPGPKEGSFSLAWSLKGSAGPPRGASLSLLLLFMSRRVLRLCGARVCAQCRRPTTSTARGSCSRGRLVASLARLWTRPRTCRCSHTACRQCGTAGLRRALGGCHGGWSPAVRSPASSLQTCTAISGRWRCWKSCRHTKSTTSPTLAAACPRAAFVATPSCRTQWHTRFLSFRALRPISRSGGVSSRDALLTINDLN
jgi:hypothetical protein